MSRITDHSHCLFSLSLKVYHGILVIVFLDKYIIMDHPFKDQDSGRPEGTRTRVVQGKKRGNDLTVTQKMSYLPARVSGELHPLYRPTFQSSDSSGRPS